MLSEPNPSTRSSAKAATKNGLSQPGPSGNRVERRMSRNTDERNARTPAQPVYPVSSGYVRYEAALRAGESALGFQSSADGAIYALRRSLYRELRSTEVNDFLHPIQAALAGFTSHFEPDAYTVEPPSKSGGQEFRRHVRIVGGVGVDEAGEEQRLAIGPPRGRAGARRDGRHADRFAAAGEVQCVNLVRLVAFAFGREGDAAAVGAPRDAAFGGLDVGALRH